MFASLVELERERRELDAREAAWLKKLAAYERSDDWRADGYLNAAAALRSACHMTPGVAHGHLELARKLEELPEVAEAFGRGDISRAHAQVIANAYTPERATAIGELARQLVEVAVHTQPRELLGVVRRITDAIDGDGGATSDEAAYARRRLHMSSTLDGMLAIDGLYDPEGGAILTAAINAEMERDRVENDPRSPAHRRADAHTNILRRSLNAGEFGEIRTVRPHVTVVVDLAELPSSTPQLVAKLRAEGRRNGQLSAATLERLTCDCDVSRVITAGRSEVLDVGRATRTISPALWKALVVRDRHCQAPGCDRPPGWCEAHHLVHWSRGGPTNLENLQLLCWHHHRHTDDARARAA